MFDRTGFFAVFISKAGKNVLSLELHSCHHQQQYVDCGPLGHPTHLQSWTQ